MNLTAKPNKGSILVLGVCTASASLRELSGRWHGGAADIKRRRLVTLSLGISIALNSATHKHRTARVQSHAASRVPSTSESFVGIRGRRFAPCRLNPPAADKTCHQPPLIGAAQELDDAQHQDREANHEHEL